LTSTARSPDGNLVFPVIYAYIIPDLAKLDPGRAAEYVAWGKELQAQTPHADGLRHFYNSDYTASHSGGSMISLKMYSKRTENNEVTNMEGLMSWHTASGALLSYRTGAEYSAIFPLWDWARIPGTTTRRARDERFLALSYWTY